MVISILHYFVCALLISRTSLQLCLVLTTHGAVSSICSFFLDVLCYVDMERSLGEGVRLLKQKLIEVLTEMCSILKSHPNSKVCSWLCRNAGLDYHRYFFFTQPSCCHCLCLPYIQHFITVIYPVIEIQDGNENYLGTKI